MATSRTIYNGKPLRVGNIVVFSADSKIYRESVQITAVDPNPADGTTPSRGKSSAYATFHPPLRFDHPAGGLIQVGTYAADSAAGQGDFVPFLEDKDVPPYPRSMHVPRWSAGDDSVLEAGTSKLAIGRHMPVLIGSTLVIGDVLAEVSEEVQRPMVSARHEKDCVQFLGKQWCDEAKTDIQRFENNKIACKRPAQGSYQQYHDASTILNTQEPSSLTIAEVEAWVRSGSSEWNFYDFWNTNKFTGEEKERIEKINNPGGGNPWSAEPGPPAMPLVPSFCTVTKKNVEYKCTQGRGSGSAQFSGAGAEDLDVGRYNGQLGETSGTLVPCGGGVERNKQGEWEYVRGGGHQYDCSSCTMVYTEAGGCHCDASNLPADDNFVPSETVVVTSYNKATGVVTFTPPLQRERQTKTRLDWARTHRYHWGRLPGTVTVSESSTCAITGSTEPLVAGQEALRLPDLFGIVTGQLLEVGNSIGKKETVLVTAVDQTDKTLMFRPGLQYAHNWDEFGPQEIQVIAGPTARNQYCNGQQDHPECSASHTMKAWSPVSWPEYACGYHEAHVRAAAKSMRVDELGRSCDTLECMRQYWTRLAERHGFYTRREGGGAPKYFDAIPRSSSWIEPSKTLGRPDWAVKESNSLPGDRAYLHCVHTRCQQLQSCAASYRCVGNDNQQVLAETSEWHNFRQRKCTPEDVEECMPTLQAEEVEKRRCDANPWLCNFASTCPIFCSKCEAKDFRPALAAPVVNRARRDAAAAADDARSAGSTACTPQPFCHESGTVCVTAQDARGGSNPFRLKCLDAATEVDDDGDIVYNGVKKRYPGFWVDANSAVVHPCIKQDGCVAGESTGTCIEADGTDPSDGAYPCDPDAGADPCNVQDQRLGDEGSVLRGVKPPSTAYLQCAKLKPGYSRTNAGW